MSDRCDHPRVIAAPFGAFLLAAWQDGDDPSFPLLRLLQVGAAASIPRVFTASTLDAGEPNGGPVHSPFKQLPGARAAAALYSLVYGATSAPFLGPRAVSAIAAAPAPGSVSVTVAFDAASVSAANALALNLSVACPSTIAAASCEAFAVQTWPDCVWRANATTAALDASGLRLVLTATGVPAGQQAVATRGLFANWPVVQLYNEDGLPAEPWLMNVSAAPGACASPWELAAAREAAPPSAEDARRWASRHA